MKKIYILLISFGLMISCKDYDILDQGFDLKELPGYVSFDADGQNSKMDPTKVDESAESVTFTIEAPTGTLTDITINYEFGGNAVFGVDFDVAGASSTGGSIVMKVDPTEVQDFDNVDLDILILTDAVTDGEKTVLINLVSASNSEGDLAVGRGGTDFLKTAAIVISDLPLEVEFNDVTQSITENSTDTTRFSIVLNYAAPEDVSVDLSTSGSLVEKEDFHFLTLFSNPVVIPKGSTEFEFEIITNDNNLKRVPYDSLLISITNVSIDGSGFSVITGSTDVFKYIIKDESKSLGFDLQSSTLTLSKSLNDAGYHSFAVKLEDNKSSESISIDYSITATNGNAGIDYIDETNGTITLSPGRTEFDVVIQVLEAAFSYSTVVTIDVKLTPTSLVTADQEVEVDIENSSFSIIVDN